MARKENKGGNLSNKDVEKELEIKGNSETEGGSYRGMQDTGDTTIRPIGTDVQRRDGMATEDLHKPIQNDDQA